MTTIGPTLEAYFANRLVSQRQASPRTINAYRDLWRLLLHFACERSGKTASKLDFGDLDAQTLIYQETSLLAKLVREGIDLLLRCVRYPAPWHD